MQRTRSRPVHFLTGGCDVDRMDRKISIFYNMILKQGQAELIVERLQGLNPVAIYLFGSQADQSARDGRSDVDICVIVPDDEEESYQKTVRAYRSLGELRFPKDIIVRHQSRFQERSNWRSSIEYEIARTGRVLYKSNEPRDAGVAR